MLSRVMGRLKLRMAYPAFWILLGADEEQETR